MSVELAAVEAGWLTVKAVLVRTAGHFVAWVAECACEEVDSDMVGCDSVFGFVVELPSRCDPSENGCNYLGSLDRYETSV